MKAYYEGITNQINKLKKEYKLNRMAGIYYTIAFPITGIACPVAMGILGYCAAETPSDQIITPAFMTGVGLGIGWISGGLFGLWTRRTRFKKAEEYKTQILELEEILTLAKK